MHNFKHSRDELLQDISLFGDNFISDLLRQRQDSLQPITKARGHLVILVLFLQELNHQALLLRLTPITNTNLKCDTGNTEDSLCNWIQLEGVNFLFVSFECWRTNLREGSSIFDRVVHRLLHRAAHQWGVCF